MSVSWWCWVCLWLWCAYGSPPKSLGCTTILGKSDGGSINISVSAKQSFRYYFVWHSNVPNEWAFTFNSNTPHVACNHVTSHGFLAQGNHKFDKYQHHYYYLSLKFGEQVKIFAYFPLSEKGDKLVYTHHQRAFTSSQSSFLTLKTNQMENRYPEMYYCPVSDPTLASVAPSGYFPFFCFFRYLSFRTLLFFQMFRRLDHQGHQAMRQAILQQARAKEMSTPAWLGRQIVPMTLMFLVAFLNCWSFAKSRALRMDFN